MMHKTIGRSSGVSPVIESLESRTLLSVSAATAVGGAIEHSAIHAEVKAPSAVTHTSAKITAGTLGQAVTIDVTVKAVAAAGAPAGTVEILNKGSLLQTLTLGTVASSNPKFATSDASIQIPGGAGEQLPFFGAHHYTFKYVPSGSLKASTVAGSFTIKQPKYAKQSDGLKIATVGTGSGVGITAGQTATMEYTGYLAKNGSIFDYSSAHTPTTFSFTVDASPEQVITGFDQGTVGMEVGETRVLYIPSKIGYGSQGAGSSIPPNANLVFLITLVSIG